MKHMIARLSIILIIISLTQISFLKCNSAGKNNVNLSKNEYFPLSDNSNWKYINEAPRDETVIIDVKCKSKNGEGKFEFSTYPFFGNDEKNVTITPDKSGKIFVTAPDGAQLLLLPETGAFKDGHIWQYNSYLSGIMSTKPVEVKTEAGTFECIYIQYTEGFTFQIEMWLAKDVGIVKWGANRTNPPALKLNYFVLKEYN